MPTVTFDSLRQLTAGAMAIHFAHTPALSATIRFRHSKTDPAGLGTTLTAACICQRVPPSVCPVHILLATMRVGMAPSEAPLFVSPHGTPVVRSGVVKVIKWLAERSGLPAVEFAGHSLQRSGATSALMAGASIPVIQALRRWKSDSFRWYLEAPDCYLAQQVASMAPSTLNGTPCMVPQIMQDCGFEVALDGLAVGMI